jgi:hypothetical protein
MIKAKPGRSNLVWSLDGAKSVLTTSARTFAQVALFGA